MTEARKFPEPQAYSDKARQPIAMQPVESSQIHRVGYDDETKTLADGYTSFSPAEEFEEGYTALGNEPSPDTGAEAAIKAAGADRAPRVTPADIEANIVGCYYFTGDDGLAGAHFKRRGHLEGMGDAHEELRLLTFCVLVLRNGFTVTGQSACASPENFNAEIGRRVAREDAVRQVWPLLGFRLRDQLAAMHRRPDPAAGAPKPAGHNPVA